MKQLLLMIAVVALVGGCASTPKVIPNSPEAKAAIEAAIRAAANKPTGELTKADYEKVTKLYLRSKQLTSVEDLEKLTQLTLLDLRNNQLTELPKGLEKLSQLEVLSLRNNQLTDVKGLEKLTQLWWLGLEKNQLTDVKGLEKLTQLTVLRLNDNKLTNAKGLEKLPQLEELYLTINQLTSVKGLEKFTKLHHLDLCYNPDITKAQIDELEKALPKCYIRWP